MSTIFVQAFLPSQPDQMHNLAERCAPTPQVFTNTMSELTADQLAQRIYDCRLLETKEIDQALAAAGGRSVATSRELISVLVKTEKLTNWQIQRIMDGHRRGYYYGNWKVLYLVGAGTFARVYRGVHRTTGDVKAIKVLRNRYSNDEDTRDSFGREARMVMKLRHPNIVPIHEVDVDRGRSYMVMDFVEGQNLRDYVRTHKGLRVRVALNILRDVASGLTYASERGITHRDMKLSNVLLTSSGSARLVDFGLATVNKDVADEGDGLFNPRSIDYAGLEKTSHAPRNDPRSDIYFLGCMFYHMISGASPLLETRERIKRLSVRRYKEIEPLTNHVEGLPHRVVILCGRLMELDPNKRVQSPSQALREIESVIAAMDSGNLAQYDKELSEKQAEEYARLIHRDVEGDGKTVMIIESNVKVQDSLREKLKDLGYRVLIVGDPVRAMQRFQDLDPAEESPADCVIFGCAGLGVAALDAFNRFAQTEYCQEIPAILLVSAKQQSFLERSDLCEHRTHLELPVKFKNVRRTLRRLLNIPDPPDDIPSRKKSKS